MMSKCLQPWYGLHVLYNFSGQTFQFIINGKLVLKIQCSSPYYHASKNEHGKSTILNTRYAYRQYQITLNHWKWKDSVSHHLHLVNCLSGCMGYGRRVSVWLDVYWTPNHSKWHFGFLITADRSSLFWNNWCSNILLVSKQNQKKSPHHFVQMRMFEILIHSLKQ